MLLSAVSNRAGNHAARRVNVRAGALFCLTVVLSTVVFSLYATAFLAFQGTDKDCQFLAQFLSLA